MMKKFKKIIALILMITTLSSCVTLHLNKDSEPLVDFGTPIVGAFRNKDYVAAGIFTSLFLSFLVCTFVFAPYSSGDKSFTGIDTSISDPLFFSIISWVIRVKALLIAFSSISLALSFMVKPQKKP